MRKLRVILIAILSLCLLFSLTSGEWLVVDNPQRADVIVALAGETDRRPNRGLELLAQGYAPKLLFDVPALEKFYDLSEVELAQRYAQQLTLPPGQSVVVCPVFGLSTKDETHDVARCLEKSGVHSILVVTSDYHTRRALSTFQHELPQYRIYVTAARDPQQFNSSWWQNRQWAKINFDEWIRLAWWEGVDRWR
jgi:uncharacterized SAM-binding protein YcdF (DUF218 family)